MATLREYYEKDFASRLRLSGQLIFEGRQIDICYLMDLEGICGFYSIYVLDSNLCIDYFLNLVNSMLTTTSIGLAGEWKVTLPNSRAVEEIKIENSGEIIQFEIRFVGDRDVTTLSTYKMPMSRRLFIYSNAVLEAHEVNVLINRGSELGYKILFRSEEFRSKRNTAETPLAFISYDSRDREIAGKIAWELEGMLCPVWYDQFSLKIGDGLRESIEDGIKQCSKCILIITPNFLQNPGWTKTEFNSIFTRQLLLNEKLILPIWYNVSKRDIYDYSPSLLDVFALEWKEDDADAICRNLYQKLFPVEG